MRRVRVALALVAALLAGCLPLNPQPNLDLAPIVEAPGEGSGPLRVEGHLEPRRYVTLALPEAGRAAEVYAREGEHVEAGAALVRLDSYPKREAELAAAELAVVLARQALEDLDEQAGVALARAEAEAAQAAYERDFAADRLESFLRRPSQQRVDQAYANLLLADNQVELAREALERAEKKFNNPKSVAWRFTNRHDFRLQITLLEQELAYRLGRYYAAEEKYAELIAPVDPVDRALRQSELDQAEARLRAAERERAQLLTGPDPDAVELARARLDAALAGLGAAQVAVRSAEVVAPISGLLARLDAEPGQWIPAGRPVAQVADLSEWVALAEEVPEAAVARAQPGREARLVAGAYPDFETRGRVEAVDLLYTEEEGEVFYTVEIGLDGTDPGGFQSRLRWGMTVEVEFTE